MCVHCMADGRACLVSYLKRNQKRWRLVSEALLALIDDDIGGSRDGGSFLLTYLPYPTYVSLHEQKQ